ncbi:MAG: PaaI family thioesterase [Halobacteriales archaeon]
MDLSAAKHLLHNSPFHQFLGIQFEKYEPGEVMLKVPFREELLVNPELGIIHGGVIASLLDIAGHYAIFSVVGSKSPTINLSVDYLSPATNSDLLVHGEVIKIGSSTGVADMKLHQSEDSQKTLAMGRATYKHS